MEFYRSHVLICGGTGCTASGSRKLMDALSEEISRRGLSSEVKVVQTGCFGFCRFGPNMVVYPEGVFYCGVQQEDVPELVEEHLLKGRVVERLLYKEPEKETAVVDFKDIPFFHKQTRVVLENCGIINPESIEEYIARDGYFALAKVLEEMTPEQVIDVIKRSGLRGRGGAGFPTGLKWELTAKATGSPKYVVCNADEGDPGAFMDRSVLEGDPHRVVEGMTIAGYAIGASRGYVYVRAEYPLAVKRIQNAIKQAREMNLLGQNILGKEFSFDIEVRLGAGAFVCGEETALLNSIMGQRGEPRPRPPFPATSGLWGKPTVINNVKTLSNVPAIIRKGPEWFASMGTKGSKGTAVFALSGKVNNNGLVEVPMGISLGEIVYDVGGGVPKGKKLKAIQIGGPSGGCIPVQYLNTPVDYESLTELGAIMGSGGLIAVDEDTCMVDFAKFFLEFVQSESCGKCAPCRIGTARMLEILRRITRGEGKEGDVELLEEMGKIIKDSAMCGLGQTAPNPVLSTIRYFRDEYDAHIRDKKCPASVCAALFDAPCRNTCPANVDVPVYIDLIRQGRFVEAYEEILRENPFPVVCGRVCHHPCEGKCRRAQLDEALAIRDLKRFAADFAASLNGSRPVPGREPPKDKSVGIVGAGPAGLTCGYYLALKGYDVTVYEALPVAGGMLAVGIPAYRLPKDALNRDIELIQRLGVKIRTGVRVGQDISWERIRETHDAVFVAIGAHKDQKMGIPGEDLKGVYSGVEFLRNLNLGKPDDVRGKNVVVVGGGNVAMDAARSSLRLGAKKVTILYRRREEDMPADTGEIKAAKEEGVEIQALTNPVGLSGSGMVERVSCVRMRATGFDASGRRRTEPVEGSTFELECDVFIEAIGQVPDVTGFSQDGLKFKQGGIFQCDPRTLATNVPGVFAGGDCVLGPKTVVEAIAQGKLAAQSIHEYLGGKDKVVRDSRHERKISGPIIEDKLPRVRAREIPPSQRRSSFVEVEAGFDAASAQKEAARCLRCDVKQ
ncbi:MAG TPA: NADH-quinone oxidoreductase subunit NuoF [Firmicutes bacterium]|nr:NADH-quinone oxidoreductase subunit NuoF [Candidatus Fermentithermobacillaceae bacterium]